MEHQAWQNCFARPVSSNIRLVQALLGQYSGVNEAIDSHEAVALLRCQASRRYRAAGQKKNKATEHVICLSHVNI